MDARQSRGGQGRPPAEPLGRVLPHHRIDRRHRGDRRPGHSPFGAAPHPVGDNRAIGRARGSAAFASHLPAMSEKKTVERTHWAATRRAGRRRLTEEEERLWAVVARSITPLRAGKRVPKREPKREPMAALSKPSPQAARPVKK